MRHFFLALAGLLGLLSMAAAAQDGGAISLKPGEQVIVAIDTDGRVAIASGGAAKMSNFDQRALVELITRYPDAIGANAAVIRGEGPAPPIEDDTITISFIRLAGRDGGSESLLIIENGYGRGLRYRATMMRGSRSEPTDVCTVMPDLRGYEHWPYQIERLDLTRLALIPYREGSAPVCE